MKVISVFFVRIAVLLILLFLLSLNKFNWSNLVLIIALVAIIFLTDAIDCGRMSPFDIDCNGYEYQSYDKIVDLLTYAVSIYVFRDLFDSFTYGLLWIFIALRGIGVFLFVTTRNIKWVMLFPDFVNGLLIAKIIQMAFGLNDTMYKGLIAISMGGKILFEQYLHKKHLSTVR